MDLPIVVVAGLFTGGIYALVAVGLNLVFGVIRVVNFAHGEFVMFGMYGAYVASLWWGLGPYISSWLIVVPVTFVLGVLIQKFVIQPLLRQHLMQIFATFGLLILFQNIALAATRGETLTVKSSSSSSSIEVFGLSLDVTRLIVLIVAVIFTGAIMLFLRTSIYGVAMRAVSQDRATATLMGINVNRTYAVVFGASTAIAAFAGALISPAYSVTPTIGLSFALPAFAVVILGGLGSVGGSLVGGLIVGVVEALSGYYIDPALKQAVWFVLFLAVLIIRPAGLFGQRGDVEMD